MIIEELPSFGSNVDRISRFFKPHEKNTSGGQTS